MDELYEALRAAEKDGRTDDVAKLAARINELSSQAQPDQRDLVPKSIGAGAGAVAGAVGVPMINKGIETVKEARNAPKVGSVTVEAAPSAAGAIDEAYGKGVSNAFTQHTREAQISERQKEVKKLLEELKLKGVSVNPNLLSEIPGQYARPGSGIHLNVETAKKIAAEEAAAAAAPKPAAPSRTIPQAVKEGFLQPKMGGNFAQDVGHFMQGISDYKLPLIGKVGPLLGNIAGGAATVSQGVDVYNRGQMDDTTGQVISGIGALGSGVATLPFPPPVRAVGAGVGLSAEAINAYRDAMRRGNIEHGAPENYEQTTPMGDQYAMGGLVYLAEGGQPDPIPIQKNNPLTEQAANKALIEIAKRKALYEIAQIAEQERARQAASRMKTSSVSPSVMPASLEPSGNGGPMLNNPLNR